MSDELTPDTPQPSQLELLRAEVQAGFKSVAARFDATDANIAARFDATDADIAARFDATHTAIAAEATATRRYFDVMVEKVESSVKLVAEVNSHHATVLNDHEKRLQNIERPRGRRG